jgi:hypothetical protein
VAYSVTLDSLGRTYSIPEAGATNWTNQTSLYLRDLSTVINSISSGTLATPVYNVRNYGATGNGTTDDTVAIKAAMAALALTGNTGGTLYFPAGTYKVTSTLQFGVSTAQKNVKVTGDGVSSVILQYGAFSTTPLLEFRNCDYWAVSTLKLSGANNSGTGDLVLVDGSSYGVLSDCTVISAQRYGVRIAQDSGSGLPSYNTVDGNVFSGNVSANVWVQGATTGNVVNQASGSRVARDYVDIKDFGAVGDATTDDTAAIQAALNSVLATGGKLYFPVGKYRVTAQLLLGYKFVSESDITVLTPDYTAAPSYDVTQRILATTAPLVHLDAAPGAIIWGDYTAVAESAILYYGIATKDDTKPSVAAQIRNLTFIGKPGMALGGAILFPSTGTAPATNVSGIFAAGTRVLVDNCRAHEVKRGLVLCSSFWSTVRDFDTFHCDYGIVSPGANATLTQNCLISYANSVAYSFEGQEFKISGAHTEECAVALYIPSADSFAVDDSYWEATGASLTDYQLKVGDGTNTVYWGSFRNLHLSSLSGKTALLKKAQVDFYTTRFYDQGTNASRMLVNDTGCVVNAFNSNVPTNTAGAGVGGVQEQSWHNPTGIFALVAALGNGAVASQNFTISGVKTSSDVHVQFLAGLPTGCLAFAEASAADTITVKVLNASGGVTAIPSTTVSLYWRQVGGIAPI